MYCVGLQNPNYYCVTYGKISQLIAYETIKNRENAKAGIGGRTDEANTVFSARHNGGRN